MVPSPLSAFPFGRAALLFALLAIASCQCGPIDPGEEGEEDGGQSSDGGAYYDAGVMTCDPACTGNDYCSSALTCIPVGTCATSDDCEVGLGCKPATHTCVPASECGSVEVTGEVVKPNLFIALDRSCSMRNPKDGGTTKWQSAVTALKTLTAENAGKIRFGLGLFPDTTPADCEQAAAAVPVADAKEAQIQSLLTSALDAGDPYYPDDPCVTNIDTGVQQAAADPAFLDKTHRGFVLLLTDGKQSNGCSAGGADLGTTQAITAMRDAGISTFVVGFGDQTLIDSNQMKTWAEAGGVPAATAAKYYVAEDGASLKAALAAIANRTLGCVQSLTQVPPHPDQLYVFFDNATRVTRDPSHQNGWDYDPTLNQVEFFGAACTKLKSGQVTDLDIVFGCDVPIN